MKTPENNNWLDDALKKTFASEKSEPNFEQWQKQNRQSIEILKSRADGESPKRPQNIGTIIMKNRITKLAVAAIIIIAALIGINHLGGSIDMASVAWADVVENMKNMPWMHGVVEGAGERFEVWFSFERKVMVSKREPIGKITYHDNLKHTVQVYDPDANTITNSHTTVDVFKGLGTALDFPKHILKLFEEASEEIIQEKGEYKGKDSKIYKMSGFLGGMHMEVEMILDKDKEVLLFVNQKVFNKSGVLEMEANAYFDYPENGPNNIYEVGVPISAKIAGSEKEKSAFDKAFEQAMAVIDNCENWPEPRDLAIAYWKVRAVKNYEEMAIFWPGSETWNRQVLEKEELGEYVFGDVQATKFEGHIIVPYATKNYFEKYRKYSLKMRLSNEKSAKGRYYIVSGN